MDINALAGAAAQSEAGNARAGLADNFETFLTLLTAQLKNQDPLEPMDSGEFTSQLVQFTRQPGNPRGWHALPVAAVLGEQGGCNLNNKYIRIG